MVFLGNLRAQTALFQSLTDVHSQDTTEGGPRPGFCCLRPDAGAKVLLFGGWNSGGMQLQTIQLGSWT